MVAVGENVVPCHVQLVSCEHDQHIKHFHIDQLKHLDQHQHQHDYHHNNPSVQRGARSRMVRRI